MVHAKRITILIGLILLSVNSFAQSFELVRPADFRYHVTVDEDTVATRSLDYKAFQDAVYHKCENLDATVTVHPIGVEVRGCPEPTVYIPYAVYEDMIRVVNWQHTQSVPDLHTIDIEVEHVADSLLTWIEACDQMWQSGEEIACNEMAYVYAEGIKGDRTVIVRDSVNLEAFNDFFLTSNQSVMYDEFTIPNPDSDLTDVVYGFNLADNMSADWWAAVNTADGTKLRVYKDDETQLAFEVVDFDDVGESGILWVRWSGTRTSSGTTKIRIEPPESGNTSYLPTDTFGSEAVWANYKAVYHLHEDAGGTAPQFIDVTGNGYDLTIGDNGDSSNTVAGKIGDALQSTDDEDGAYDADTELTYDSGSSPPDVTLTIWTKLSNNTQAGKQIIGWGEGGGLYSDYGRSLQYDNGTVYAMGDRFTSGRRISASLTDTASFHHIVGLFSSSGALWIDGAEVATGDIGWHQNYRFAINSARSGTSDVLEGIGDEARVYEGLLPDDYITHEYANQNDMATFWGVGTWVEGGGSTFEASFSIDSTLQASSSSVSTAEAGISLDANADVSDGSTATGESLLTIAHNQNASTQSDANAEASLSLSNLLQIAFSKQSVTDASFSLPVVHQVTTVSDTQIVNEASFSLALQKAITTEQISTIEVSYSLNSAQQTAMQSVSTAEAAMSITLTAAINFISTALAEADISFNAVQSLTFSGQTVGVEVTLADGRTLTISLENRTYLIPQETRTFTILSENRTLTIEP